MKAYVLSDGEFQTESYRKLEPVVCGYLEQKGFEVEKKRIEKDELTFCRGCFGCWVKKPGECVIGDGIGQINRASMNSDVVVYLCPVVFGQFSANIKTVIERWLPNMLPFFMTRPDGSTMHPARYETYPQSVLIGYAEDWTEEDRQLFYDITKKHRSNVNVFIWQGSAQAIVEELESIKLTRVGGLL